MPHLSPLLKCAKWLHDSRYAVLAKNVRKPRGGAETDRAIVSRAGGSSAGGLVVFHVAPLFRDSFADIL